MGSTGGGVWKTVDGGLTWENTSDTFFSRASVGAIAVSSSDPNVVYVGMGEACIRGDVSHGDGVYRSNDAGRTWVHLGLADTRHIARVRIDPNDPDVAYVAALGHAHGPNSERGVFRTRDGGRTWKKVLSRGAQSGAIDLTLDPSNSRVLYATLWEVIRLPWTLTSGGLGSGIFRSTDGGDSWTELTRNRGLPSGLLGRIGIASSPARPRRVWAIIEAEEGGVYRSDDGGETWQVLCQDRSLRQRPWYCNHIFADPIDPETVWVLSVAAWRSTDGGRTFDQVAFPHGDHHDLWIDPRDPRRLIGGNDGGATVSFNGGESWSSTYNQPTAELYHVAVDRQTPYRLYGAQQDYGTISVPSRSPLLGITPAEAYEVGGSESGYIAVRPDDPNIVYAGSAQPPRYLSRYDHRTGQARQILVWPEFNVGSGAAEARYRFQWTHPLFLSPHDPDTLYVAGNHVFRTKDEGMTWDVVSPDLTRADKSKLGPSGGPITGDNTGAEYYCTIFALAESPLVQGLLWAGSDDGLVHVTRDDGKSWKSVTPPKLPKWTTVSSIEPSPHDAATAYVAAMGYKLDDFHPYVFKTTNFGRTWSTVVAGIPKDVFVRVVREDPERPGLLYAGTETGVYVSFDAGQHWSRWQAANFPVVPVHDLVVHDSDLVVATHGRSFWIFDDLAPVRQLAAAAETKAVHLFTPRPAIRYITNSGFGHEPLSGKNYRTVGAQTVTYRQFEDPDTRRKSLTFLNAGANPPDGAIITYYLGEQAMTESLTLTIRDKRGRLVRRFSSASGGRTSAEMRLPTSPGLNRFVWNLRYSGASPLKGTEASMGPFRTGLEGPIAPPGTYGLTLTAGGHKTHAWLGVRRDPRSTATDAGIEAQVALLLRIRDKLSEVHEAAGAIRAAREQLEAWRRLVNSRRDLRGLSRLADRLIRSLSSVEEEFLQTRAQIRQDTLNFPIRLNAKLGGLAFSVASADGPPTRAAYEVFEALAARTDRVIVRWRQIVSRQVATFDRTLRQKRVGVLIEERRSRP